MTKEQKYPLAEPATYTSPQMEVIPLRGNSAMLIGSIMPLETFSVDEDFRDYFQSTEDGSTPTEGFGTADGWGNGFWD